MFTAHELRQVIIEENYHLNQWYAELRNQDSQYSKGKINKQIDIIRNNISDLMRKLREMECLKN